MSPLVAQMAEFDSEFIGGEFRYVWNRDDDDDDDGLKNSLSSEPGPE